MVHEEEIKIKKTRRLLIDVIYSKTFNLLLHSYN